MKTGTIFFDYDGTLHDSMRVYGPAFKKAYRWLVDNGHAEPRVFEDDWISHWLGWTTRDMWTTFMPGLSEEVWRQASQIVGDEMARLSETGASKLFDGVPETLDLLKDTGFTLAILSNCRDSYRHAHVRYHDLGRWFDTFTCADDYPGLKKWEMYGRIADDVRHPHPHVMVGDRFHDIEVGSLGGIPTVGCAFGFSLEGELDAATVIIESFKDLPSAIEEVVA